MARGRETRARGSKHTGGEGDGTLAGGLVRFEGWLLQGLARLLPPMQTRSPKILKTLSREEGTEGQ